MKWILAISTYLLVSSLQIVTAQWQDASNMQLGDFFHCKFISSRNGWVSAVEGAQEGLLKTTDAGETWTKILDHQPGTFNWIYSFDFLEDSIGYAASLRGQRCFRTLNSGHRWDTVGCGGVGGNAIGAMGTIKIFALGLAYAGAGAEFYRSVDSLKTWQRISFLPQGGMFPSGFRFAFFSPDTIVAYGGSASLLGGEWTGTIECYKSTDGGFTWSFPFVDTLEMAHAGSFGSNSVGYAFTGIWEEGTAPDPHYKTHKTTDGGATWFQIPARFDSGGILVADAYFRNPMEGFVSGNALAHTTDGGLTWMRIHEVGNVVNMSWPDSLHGWLVGRNGRIFRTTTGGLVPALFASFAGEHTGGTRVRVDWRTRSETNTAGFHLQRRSEGDTTFADISSLIPGQGTTSEPSDYSFTDTTATINRWYYRLKVMPLTGAAHYSNTILVDVTTGVSNGLTQFEYKLEQNFPNPFNPTTTIKFQIPSSNAQLGFGISDFVFASLKVFDVLGREVATLVGEVKQPGEYSVGWDASGFSSGVYFYRMHAGAFIQTKRMILMR